LFREGVSDFVYLKSGNSFKKKEIKTGQQNTDFIIITEGLDEGDQVALTNPFAAEDEAKNEQKEE
jgi:HlyD family secretion protein